MVPAVEAVESAELEFTLEIAGVELVLPEDRAEVEAVAGETPFVVDGVSRELLERFEPAPAPDDEPPVLDAVAATVPDVVVCT